METLDARGLACPEPVMLTRGLLSKAKQGGEVIVDNTCAVENITRYANNNGYTVEVSEDGADYRIKLSKK